MPRGLDSVRVEADGLGSFDRFTTLSITTSMTEPSEAAFEVGDDSTWPELRDFLALGQQYKVFVNERLALTGRVELSPDISGDATSGTSVRFTIRSKFTDAHYGTADSKISVHGVTLKDWLVKIYAQQGYQERDFIFRANVARDLITGKPSKATREPLVDPEAIQEQAAKPRPPETVFEAADRHLRRYGLMHWNTADDKIVVSAPDDEQEPTYHFRYFTGPESVINNVLEMGHSKDASETPSLVFVTGKGYVDGDDNYIPSSAKGFVQDDELVNAVFVRPVIIIAEQMKKQALAESAARREMSARSMKRNTFGVLVDGLSFWDGDTTANFAIDTVADVITDPVGGPLGAYYVHKVELRRTPTEGDTARLTMLAKGIWRI